MVLSAPGWANPGPDDPARTPLPATAEPAAAVPPSPRPREALRLGLYHREVDAWMGWKTLMRQYPTLLEGLTPAVQPLDLGSNGRFPALIAVGEPGRDLDGLCRRMLGKGMGCFLITIADAATPPQPPAPPVQEPAVQKSAVPAAEPLPVPAEEPAGAVSSVRRGLQLGVYLKDDDAWRGWEALMRRHPALLSGVTPTLVDIALPGRGIHRALVGIVEPPASLTVLCARLRSEGSDCWVIHFKGTAAVWPPAAPAAPAATMAAPVPPPVPVEAAAPEAPPKRGDRIVISIADRQLYYTSPDGARMTFPIAIGRDPTLIVTGRTEIVRKRTNPIWVPTPDMRRKDPKLPAKVGPGPRNPMGAFALDLGWRYIRIHGTNDPDSVGNAVSSGCYRMHTKDIKTLYSLAGVGTPVEVVNASIARGEMAPVP